MTKLLMAARTRKAGAVGKLSLAKMVCMVFVFCAATAIVSPAQIFKTIATFDGSNGDSPYLMSLVQGTNGNFYGTTELGGAHGSGTVFKITPGGTLTALYSFCALANCSDGANPYAGLVQATDGNFYGTTAGGGSRQYGTVFKITPAGTLTTLHSFNETDGASPVGGLVQATDGNLYGTTRGAYGQFPGTVFKITAAGTLTTLHGFNGTDGDNATGGLLQATNGAFYGTTAVGGDLRLCGGSGCGTVFSVSMGLGPFVKTLPAAGEVGAKVIILGTKLTGATSVSFNGTPAKFTVVSKSEITTRVPRGATTGKIKVKTPHRTLLSNVPFRVRR